MNRLTFSQVAPAVARVLGLGGAGACLSDPRIAEYTNRAQEALMVKGKWVGTLARYRICVTSGCITWPRFIETIERFAVCNQPGSVFGQWYEFLENGPGLLNQETACGWGCCGTSLLHRDNACTFEDITVGDATATPPVPFRRIQTFGYTQGLVNEAASASIILRGYDENRNWIWTENPEGTMLEGEKVAIVRNDFSTSTRYFSALASVIKTPTVGDCLLYEVGPPYDGTGTRTKLLARYEPDELTPIYRRSEIPGLSGGGDCPLRAVDVLAKLRHIPVANPNDFLVLGCLNAFPLMVQALLKQERNLIQESVGYEQLAVQRLQEELASYLGDGQELQIRFAPGDIWGGGGIVTPM
jgi:hypothetical protein